MTSDNQTDNRITETERINAINKQISNACVVISKRERSVKRAERNLEIAEDHLADLENQRDDLIIASWGDTPNWQGIFGMSEDASSAMRSIPGKMDQYDTRHAPDILRQYIYRAVSLRDRFYDKV